LKNPVDFSLIKITSSTKQALLDFSTKSTTGTYAIMVNDWEEMRIDYPYMDIPFEPKIISKLFEESLGAEPLIAESLQSPLASCPNSVGNVGGIYLASILDDSESAKE
jgi:hypothetical protein